MSDYGEVQRAMHMRVAVLLDTRKLAPMVEACYRLEGAARDAFRRRHGAAMEKQVQDGIKLLCGEHDASRETNRPGRSGHNAGEDKMQTTTNQPTAPSLSEQLDAAEAEIKRLKGRGATTTAARVPGPLETAARAKMAVKPLSLTPLLDKARTLEPREKTRFLRQNHDAIADERLLAFARERAMAASEHAKHVSVRGKGGKKI